MKEKMLYILMGVLGIFIVLLLVISFSKKDMYELTIELDDTVLKTQVVEGTKICETKPEKEGYVFKYWSKDGSLCDADFEIKENITIKAVFEKKVEVEEVSKYEIKFNSDGGTSINSQTIEENGKVVKPSNPTKEGYIFKYWSLNGVEYDFNSKVNKSFELKAVYEKETEKEEDNSKYYKVTFNSSGGTTVKSQDVKENGKVTKPSNPTKPGYEFVAWTLNGKNYDFNSKVTSNITLIATWKEKEVVKTYTIGITKVDEYSPDRYLTVYENGTAIKVSKLMYTDGVQVQAAANGNKLSVAYSDIVGEASFKVQLANGSVVTAKVK